MSNQLAVRVDPTLLARLDTGPEGPRIRAEATREVLSTYFRQVDASGLEGERLVTATERYVELLSRERRSLRALLTPGECGLILAALNGSVFADVAMVRHLPSEIEDALGEGLEEQWGVEGPALVDKLMRVPYPALCALVDACERWWRKSGDKTPADLLEG